MVRANCANVCPFCQGEGRVSQPEAVEVRIPPARGRARGSVSLLRAGAGTLGGPAGDLYITVRVEDHPFFHRDGDDVVIKVPITVSEACLGAKIEVPTVDGRALLKIPQGTKKRPALSVARKGHLQRSHQYAWRSVS